MLKSLNKTGRGLSWIFGTSWEQKKQDVRFEIDYLRQQFRGPVELTPEEERLETLEAYAFRFMKCSHDFRDPANREQWKLDELGADATERGITLEEVNAYIADNLDDLLARPNVTNASDYEALDRNMREQVASGFSTERAPEMAHA